MPQCLKLRKPTSSWHRRAACLQISSDLAVTPEKAALIREDFLKQMRAGLHTGRAASPEKASIEDLPCNSPAATPEDTASLPGKSDATALVPPSQGGTACAPGTTGAAAVPGSQGEASSPRKIGATSTSLLMLPSWLSELPTGHETGGVLAIDFGGTSFRVMYVVLGRDVGEEACSQFL
jgi:hypothetical protein